MKKKVLIIIAAIILGLLTAVPLLIKEELELPKLESADISKVYFDDCSESEKEILDIDEFLEYYNNIYDIRDNVLGEGTTPETYIRIELRNGEEISISNSGDQFQVDFKNDKGEGKQYWGKQQEIANMLRYGFYTLGNSNIETSENFKYEIAFPYYPGKINPKLVVTNNIDKNKIKNEEILGKYYIVEEEISSDRRKHIIKVFGMEDVDAKIKERDGITIETYEKGSEELTIYSNGSYQYKKNKNRNEAMMKSVEIEDQILIEKASKFLKDNELIPGDFAYSKMGATTLTNMATKEEKILTKDLYFMREINGIEVEGTSKIVVYMNGDGEIEEIYSSYREIKETVTVKENYTVDEMIERLKSLNGTLYINENADEITMDSVDIIYYEDSAPFGNNVSIQPIYRVRGSSLKNGEEIDEFLGLTAAVKR